jgi:hypothetical protein
VRSAKSRLTPIQEFSLSARLACALLRRPGLFDAYPYLLGGANRLHGSTEFFEGNNK